MLFICLFLLVTLSSAQYLPRFFGPFPDMTRFHEMMSRESEPIVEIVPVFVPVPEYSSRMRNDNRGGQFMGFNSQEPGFYGQGPEFVNQEPTQREFRTRYRTTNTYGMPEYIKKSLTEETTNPKETKISSTEKEISPIQKKLKKTLSNWKPEEFSNFKETGIKEKSGFPATFLMRSADPSLRDQIIQLETVQQE